MAKIKQWQAEESVKDAIEINNLLVGESEIVAIMATMIHCAKLIAASAPRDDFVSYLFDVASGISNINETLKEFSDGKNN